MLCRGSPPQTYRFPSAVSRERDEGVVQPSSRILQFTSHQILPRTTFLQWTSRGILASASVVSRQSVDSRAPGGAGGPLRGTVASARCRRRKPHSRGSLGVPRAGCDSACSAEGLPASPGALSTSFRDRTLARWLAGGRLLARARHLSNPLFLEARRFPGQLAEVVELGAPDCGPLDHLDLVDPRRVQREGALHPHSIRDAPDREGCPGAPTALPDDHPLEGLKPLLFALDDLHPHLHGVPGSDAPPVLLELPCVHDEIGR